MGTQGKAQQAARRDRDDKGAKTRRRVFLFGAGATIVAGLAGWQFWPTGRGTAGTVTTDAIGDQVQRVPTGQLPEFAGTGEIGRLYRYAVEHGNDLQFIPCFCGCVRFGHKSNLDCYIKAFHQDGTLTFTSHAAT